MLISWILLLMGGIETAAVEATPGLNALAAAGHWDRVLEVSVRRGDQLPLRPEEALVAAYAARVSGDVDAQVHFLTLAVESEDVGAVARVELAELVVREDPKRALDLVFGLLRRAPSKQLREAATEVAEMAVNKGVGADRRSALQRLMSSLNRDARRKIELALAVSADPVDRSRLGKLLASSTADLVALAAAEELEGSAKLGVVDRWRVAQTFYRYGLYDRAIPILESLVDVRNSQVPGREVAYIRGRCAFRRGEWSVAADWYGRAISMTSPGERRAKLEVHLGRTHELAGEMDEAVAAAQRAVRLKTTDDRRLFLARLRLRRGETDLAEAGLSRLRSRTARARGELMLGLFELRAGDDDAAQRRLGGITRNPWRAPASVLASELAVESDQPAVALGVLIASTPGMDSYWAGEARTVMAKIPDEMVDGWREEETAAFGDLEKKTRRRAMGRALKLEIDPKRLAELRSIAAVEVDLAGKPEQPEFPPGLAAHLWNLGLRSSAVRWDPSDLPRDTPRSTWWTAERELEVGQPWLAIRVADTARWQASSSLPPRGLPDTLRRALYPLPFEETAQSAAERHGLPWSLLAGVAREESRWNPMVVSKVGARGLMQLMPATALAVGASNGRPEVTPDDLFEPLISLDLGAAELSRLLGVFGGNRSAAVAAYNAGEAQAGLWLDQCGEPCSESRFLAHVSFSVTRSYTEAVLGAARVYEELYGGPVVSERSE